MNICFIAITEFPGITFPELRNAASELTLLGHSVTVIAKGSEGQAITETVDGIQVFRIPCRNRIQTELFFWRAARIAKQVHADIFHVFWRFGAGIVPLLLGRHHCLLDIRTGSISQHAWRRSVENGILRLDRRLFRYAITLDEPLARHLGIRVQGYIPEGIPRSLLAPNTTEKRSRLRKQQGWSDRDRIGIYLGTSYSRRLDVFFTGWLAFAKDMPSLKLLVVGDAIRDASLRDMAASSEGKIELHQNIAPEDVPALLSAVDFGVAFVPNTPGFAYQQSTKILEYIARSLPVLATDTPANQRLVQAEVQGLCIKDTLPQMIDGLQQFFAWLPHFRHDEQSSTRILETYCWPKIVAQTLVPLYTSLL